MKTKKTIIALGICAILGLAGLTMASLPVVSIDNAVKCSDGYSKVDLGGSLRFRSNGSDPTWPSCYASPSAFMVKIFSIKFVPADASLQPVVVYRNDSPDFVDLAAANTQILSNFDNLPSGTYKAIELVVDSAFKIKIDEQVPTLDGTTSRVITKVLSPEGVNFVNNTGLSNINFTMDGHPNIKHVLPRVDDTNVAAELIDFEQKAFWYQSDNIQITKYGGDSSQRRAYGHKASWSVADHPVIGSIVHFLNLTDTGTPLDLDNSGFTYPKTRGTITLNLKNNLNYNRDNGLLVDWKWDIRKMFWLGFLSESGSSPIKMITLGPYSFDLGFTEVSRTENVSASAP